ncbi:MAG: hypothetical protein LBP50_10030 [Tannerella sp.]|jgi:hypothetical protein|nr:hypothetical protein [Tannerella sp.]
MSVRSDYIPKKDSELVPWSANFTAQVTANASAWGIPSGEISGLQKAGESFAALQAKADSPAKTSVIVAEKNAARRTLVNIIRTLAGFRLKNPVITDAQRVALGLHVRTSTYTATTVPHTRPELEIEVVDFRRLKLLFRDMGSRSRAKPGGVNGAVVAYAVLDAPPASPEALTRNVLATRTPYMLEFTEDERGKTVYVALCWQNVKGQRGPWSEIGSAVVP